MITKLGNGQDGWKQLGRAAVSDAAGGEAIWVTGRQLPLEFWLVG